MSWHKRSEPLDNLARAILSRICMVQHCYGTPRETAEVVSSIIGDVLALQTELELLRDRLQICGDWTSRLEVLLVKATEIRDQLRVALVKRALGLVDNVPQPTVTDEHVTDLPIEEVCRLLRLALAEYDL